MCEENKNIKIWSFVKEKLKISVPSSIKNVLSYCGYDNFYTISAIDEDDLEYMAAQVKKGGITKYFSEQMSLKNALKGSPFSEKNFEFSRGHQKLLMRIVKLVRTTLSEKGVEGFTEAKEIKKLVQKK